MKQQDKDFFTELVIGNLKIEIKDNVVEPEFDPNPLIEWIEGMYEKPKEKKLLDKLSPVLTWLKKVKKKAGKIGYELKVTYGEIRNILRER